MIGFDLFDFDTNIDSTRRMIANLSDNELLVEFLFLDYLDSFECELGVSVLWIGISNYAELVYYELAKRYLNGRRFYNE